MSIRTGVRSACKLCSVFIVVCFLGALGTPRTVSAQGLELNGGWSHNTGDFGTDGYEVGVAWWFTKRVTLAANYDSIWDNSTLTSFEFSSIGPVAVNSYLQNVLIGPRIFFTTDWTTRHKFNPFGEAQFGASELSQKVSQPNAAASTNSGTAFSWMLGGGGEYLFSPHWSGRANLDFLRTHLENRGQSRLRFVLGLTYTFGARE